MYYTSYIWQEIPELCDFASKCIPVPKSTHSETDLQTGTKQKIEIPNLV